jgi:hypothetical protein
VTESWTTAESEVSTPTHVWQGAVKRVAKRGCGRPNPEAKQRLFEQHTGELRGWITVNLPTLDVYTTLPQLLNALPDLEIKSEAAFLAACKKWLRVRQCEKFFKAEKDSIATFLADNLFVEDWQTEVNAALQHLVENFHLFGGKSRGDFWVWAARRLRRLPALMNHATLRDYIALGIEDFDDAKPDLSDFKFTEHEMPFGKEFHIQLEGGHVWRIRDLKQAKALWPVRVMTINGTPYLVKVVRGHTVFVHRLFFRIEIGDVVRAYDGDYLNMSLYPFSRHEEAYWGDWKDPKKKNELKGKLKLTRAADTKPIYTKLTQQWVRNLHVAHDVQSNASAQERQEKFEETCMFQPLEFEDVETGEKKRVDFGGMPSGYLNPVSTADVVRPVKQDTQGAWEKLDSADERESAGVQYDMNVSAIRDYNRDADQAKYRAKDGDVAGEEPQSRESRRVHYEPPRRTIVEDVAVLEAEIEKSEIAEPEK